MFRRILVPLDRSNFAEQALVEASAIARKAYSAIRLLLVHQPLPYGGFEDVPWYPDESSAESGYLATISRELLLTNIPTTSTVLEGIPAKVICEEAADTGCDLIVMTSHGRTGLSRMWIGSVADAVVRHSTVPVLLVRPADHEKPLTRPAKAIHRILIPLDGSKLSRKILPAATALAKCTGAQVTLLRVVQPAPLIQPVTSMPMAFSSAVYDESLTKDLVAAAEKDVAAEKAALDADVTSIETRVVVATSAAHAIMEYIENGRIDLVAMSTHGRGASRLLLGSVADKIIRASSIPMLLYRPPVNAFDEQREDGADKVVAAA